MNHLKNEVNYFTNIYKHDAIQNRCFQIFLVFILFICASEKA